MADIIFTSAGRRVELIQLFRNSLNQLQKSARLIACDVDPLAPAMFASDERVIMPRTRDAEYPAALAKICSEHPGALVIPLTDPDLQVLATSRASLEAAGAILILSPKTAVDIAADKWSTKLFLDHIGLAAPTSWLRVDDVPSDVVFPLIIKPRNGSASQNVFRVNNWHELRFFADYVEQSIIQEFLTGPEITTDVLCHPLRGEFIGFVSRRRLQTRAGEVSRGVTIYNPMVASACQLIAEKLCARGPINIQCFLTPTGPKFTEINARFGGGTPLAVAAGFDQPTLLIKATDGEDMTLLHKVGDYRPGLFMSRYDQSYFLDANDEPSLASHYL